MTERETGPLVGSLAKWARRIYWQTEWICCRLSRSPLFLGTLFFKREWATSFLSYGVFFRLLACGLRQPFSELVRIVTCSLLQRYCTCGVAAMAQLWFFAGMHLEVAPVLSCCHPSALPMQFFLRICWLKPWPGDSINRCVDLRIGDASCTVDKRSPEFCPCPNAYKVIPSVHFLPCLHFKPIHNAGRTRQNSCTGQVRLGERVLLSLIFPSFFNRPKRK